MGEGRAYTHESLDTKQRHAVAVPARFRLPSTEHPGVKRTVRISAFTRCGGTYPAWGPLPGLPWSQRPLQEDLSRYAENQPFLRPFRFLFFSFASSTDHAHAGIRLRTTIHTRYI